MAMITFARRFARGVLLPMVGVGGAALYLALAEAGIHDWITP